MDIVFCLPPISGDKSDYHYRSAFYLAVVSMITGWDMDDKVSVIQPVCGAVVVVINVRNSDSRIRC